MNSRIIRIAFLLLLNGLIPVSSYSQGLIKTSGTQFVYENGSPFYSLCMTYVVELTFYKNTPPSGEPKYHIAPKHSYGPVPYNCWACSTEAGCLDRIRTDFENIKSMGFNTVHVAGLSPATIDVFLDPPPADFILPFNVLDLEYYHYDSHTLVSPLSSDTKLPILFQAIKDVAAIAEDIGLQLMIDGQTNHDFTLPGSIDLYTEYLDLLSQYIVDEDVALMAYILMGEPSNQNLNDDHRDNTKQEVCDVTAQWYDVIRSNDPNHLIGYGIYGLENLFTWDPGVIKMDFFFPHVYLDNWRSYEDEDPSNTNTDGPKHNLDKAIDRINAQLYWFKNNSPVPWMQGETGFKTLSASYTSPSCSPICQTADCLDDPHSTSCSSGSFGTSTFGTEEQQQDFFASTLEMTRNCGAAGYAVWEYQDNAGVNDCLDNFGLLRRGDPTATNFESMKKPAVEEFENYLTGDQAPNASLLTSPPTGYYDMTHNAEYAPSGIATANIIHGKVTLEDGTTPIKDALVKAHTFKEFDLGGLTDPDGPFFIPLDNVSYTFTDENGDFTLMPYNPKAGADISTQYIRWIEITAMGSSRTPAGSPYNEYGFPAVNAASLPPKIVDSAINTVMLKKIDLNLNDVVENQTITGSPDPFQAYRTVTIKTNNSVQNGAVATFKALDAVHIEGEFHANGGSEVHVYNEAYYANCDDIDDAGGFKKGQSKIQAKNVNIPFKKEKQMELSFRKKEPEASIDVFPNPNSNGLFTLNYSVSNEQTKIVTVLNLMGALVYNGSFTGKQTNIDLSSLSKGIYYLQIQDQQKTYNKKLIIQ